MRRLCSLVLFSMISFAAADLSGGTAFETERNLLFKNLHDILFDKSVEAPLKNFQSDGTWSDIDYADHSRGSSWSPYSHLRRMEMLASARPDLAVKALDAWCKKAPSSTNWWWECIGIPQGLCTTILIIRPENIPADLMKKLEPAIRKTFVYWPGSKNKLTGQNLIWVEEIRFYTGLLYNQPELIREAYSEIISELKITPVGKEGLQDDFSYHQHGMQLQVGGYGLSFLETQIRWARFLKGTSLAYSNDQIKLLDLYFMNCMRWTLADGVMDYNFCGRQIWDGIPAEKYKAILRYGKSLMPLMPAKRQDEYRKWFEDPEKLSGAMAYPRSACLIYRTPEWRLSLKMSSSKIIGSETINSENKHGLYQGDGVLFFGNMKRYAGYPVLFEQRRLPGTTEVQNSVSLECSNGIRNTNGSYALIADFPFAIAALRMDSKDIQADKVWFCTPSGVTCAASAIKSDSESPVVTTVDQFRADSEKVFPVEYSGDGLQRTVTMRKGNWKDSFGEFPSKPISGEVVTISIDHGIKPREAGYWYSIRKKDVSAQKESRLKTSSERIHALLSGERVLTAAFVEGSVELPNGKKLKIEPGIAVWTTSGTLVQKADFRVQ